VGRAIEIGSNIQTEIRAGGVGVEDSGVRVYLTGTLLKHTVRDASASTDCRVR